MGYLFEDKDGIREIMCYGTFGETLDGNYIGSLIRETPENFTDIHIHILSDGGDIINGLGIITAILFTAIPVTTFNDGVAASMAGVIYLAGKTRKMFDFALLMLHEPNFWGMTADEVSDDKVKEALIRFKEMLLRLIVNATGKTEEEVTEILSKDTWYNAEEAKAMGLVDEVIQSDFKDLLNQPAKVIITKIAAKLKNTMELKPISEALGLQDTATVEDIKTAITALKDQAALIEGLNGRITEFEAEKEELNTEILRLSGEIKSIGATAGDTLIAEARLSGKLTIADALQLKGKPLQEITATLKTKVIPKKITDVLQGPGDIVAMKKEYDTLFRGKNGELAQVKKNSPERYRALFMARYGVEPNKS
jgi:ATP-dependent Clp protease protease subunit